MDTTDSAITFDEHGVCNHCRDYEKLHRRYLFLDTDREKLLKDLIEKIKRDGVGNRYDCVIGVSGGVDSSYLLHLAVQYGLRVLPIHVDSGWNSELAVKNIENLVVKLGLHLYTIVCDWDEIRDLQRSFLKAGVPNCDIPQDHAYVASVYKIAKQFKIKYILSGLNYATESILPKAWGHTFRDLVHIKDVHSKFGEIKLRNYPSMNFFEYNYLYPCIYNIKTVRILNTIDYDKQSAKQLLMDKYDWRDYGGKHYESLFTKFFQGYYLPKKFGYDKRKAHLSSLIVSGQITRKEALVELLTEPLDEEFEKTELPFVLKKLGFDDKQWSQIMNQNPIPHSFYKTEAFLMSIKTKLEKIFSCRWDLI